MALVGQWEQLHGALAKETRRSADLYRHPFGVRKGNRIFGDDEDEADQARNDLGAALVEELYRL